MVFNRTTHLACLFFVQKQVDLAFYGTDLDPPQYIDFLTLVDRFFWSQVH